MRIRKIGVSPTTDNVLPQIIDQDTEHWKVNLRGPLVRPAVASYVATA